MLKPILSQIKEFKRDSILTPIMMLLEVIMEMIIPLLMASIIDKGVTAGDLGHIERTGVLMLGVTTSSSSTTFCASFLGCLRSVSGEWPAV